ncbi:hypothetical protein MICAG_2110006 [Microcystis aeruginosa PCC 9808]|uniref:Uncharacterized protein n=1 Tax=Microcystis aeruginosa PCC 9808 TaxID=1160284 RepID=I4HNE2_MICAE|nr:hypothetical protein MICAG_2110006 [Microcystis aeruginosa PCC 9808]
MKRDNQLFYETQVGTVTSEIVINFLDKYCQNIELETHWLISQRVELASPQSVNPILNQCESVVRLLLTLIRALENK